MATALLGGISLMTARDLAKLGWKFSMINAFKRAGLPYKSVSKSKPRTSDGKVCLDQYFLDNFLFQKYCLFMCTCS